MGVDLQIGVKFESNELPNPTIVGVSGTTPLLLLAMHHDHADGLLAILATAIFVVGLFAGFSLGADLCQQKANGPLLWRQLSTFILGEP